MTSDKTANGSGSDVELAYTLQGPQSGSPIILLHGFPLDRTMWKAQTDALVAAGHRVLRPDLRGHGLSPVRTQAATMDRMAQDVVRLADQLGFDRFLLGGFSMGGYVALQLYATRPQRVRGLLLVDTRAEPDAPEAQTKRRGMADQVRSRGLEVLVEAMVPRFFTPRTRALQSTLLVDVENVIRKTPREGAVQALLGMAERSDQRVLLPRVHVPTLIVVGAQDELTPPAASHAMAKGIDGAVLNVLPGAAHLTPVEAPDAVNSAMFRWLTMPTTRTALA